MNLRPSGHEPKQTVSFLPNIRMVDKWWTEQGAKILTPTASSKSQLLGRFRDEKPLVGDPIGLIRIKGQHVRRI